MTQELSFYEKLSDIQSKLVAAKDKENKFGGFSYRTAEGILAAIKPHLATHKLFMYITDEIVQIGSENEVTSETNNHKVTKDGLVTTNTTKSLTKDGRFYLRATVTVTDGKDTVSTFAMARESLDKKGMDTAQITGAASSYARKYALNGMWGIDDAKQDPDAKTGDDAMMKRVDTALDSCKTREEAVTKMGAIKASPACTPSVLKYAMAKFKEKFPTTATGSAA